MLSYAAYPSKFNNNAFGNENLRPQQNEFLDPKPNQEKKIKKGHHNYVPPVWDCIVKYLIRPSTSRAANRRSSGDTRL